jgi:LmbE family N-acetylglucosaminyl deacetylase
MPTIFRIDGLRVVIYPADHHPAHVHVIGAVVEAIFNLQCPEGPPILRENNGFKSHELAPLAERLAVQLKALCSQWRNIHGHYH